MVIPEEDVRRLERFNFLSRVINVNICLLMGFSIAAILFLFGFPVIVKVLLIAGWVANVLYGVFYIRRKLCISSKLDRRHAVVHYAINNFRKPDTNGDCSDEI